MWVPHPWNQAQDVASNPKGKGFSTAPHPSPRVSGVRVTVSPLSSTRAFITEQGNRVSNLAPTSHPTSPALGRRRLLQP